MARALMPAIRLRTKRRPSDSRGVILVGVGGTVLTLIMPFMLIYRIRRFVMRKPRRAAAVQHSEPEREREPHRAPMPARPLPVTMPELTPNLDDAVVRRFDRNVQQRLAELELARAPAAAIESRPPVSRGFGRKPV